MKKQLKVTLIKVDGTEQHIDKQLSLEEMQKFVGGLIEPITFPNGETLVCNEEGKLENLPYNEKATLMWQEQFPIADYPIGGDDIVVGDVLIMSKEYDWDKE